LVSCQGYFANIVTSQITTTDRVMGSYVLFVDELFPINDPYRVFGFFIILI
jgi:hypothetical protein